MLVHSSPSFGYTLGVGGPPRTRTAFSPGKNRGFTLKVCDPRPEAVVPPVGLEPTQAGLKDRNPSSRAPAAEWSRAPSFSLLSSRCHRASPRNRTLRASEGEPFTAALEPSSARREALEPAVFGGEIPRNAESRLQVSLGRLPLGSSYRQLVTSDATPGARWL